MGLDNLTSNSSYEAGRDGCKTMIESIAIMRFHHRLEPQPYEQRLQELRRERNAEIKQAERLSAVLAKKVSMIKERIPDRAA